MPTIGIAPVADAVKVAAVFEAGGIRPAWFQLPGGKPVPVTGVSAVWHQGAGPGKRINFEVETETGHYCLSFDPFGLSWGAGRTVVE